MTKTEHPRIGVVGAGAIGCYLGGCIASAGYPVTFIGRARIGDQIREHGLSVTDYEGRNDSVPAENILFSEDPAALADCDLAVVAVKGGDTASAAEAIAAHLPTGAVVASYQNGVRSAGELAAALPNHKVLAGMVPYNVVNNGRGGFHRGTEGELGLQQRDSDHEVLARAFREGRLPVSLYADMQTVQWGKLLLNLNNPINALSGLPLKQQLETRAYRRVLSASISEAMTLLKAAGIKPARMGKVHPKILPLILRVPDGVFKTLAKGMLQVDPKATSSMQEDLKAGKRTEIDFLNGELLRLSEETGLPAPVSRSIVTLIREAEAAAKGCPNISGEKLMAAVGL